ncbi:MAG: bifunctional adenosylcobinamide kinase/adenosylcobinamide-phosphate guanylyltransferase [Lachnospiraceae bacterium]|nr:bifunctional adenosylcobinamide kinase/adenosylcobinamide-phosphate guanylyltransferase [Lachnospiraceae bacterium]
MVLIIGSAFQGKTEYAKSLCSITDTEIFDGFERAAEWETVLYGSERAAERDTMFFGSEIAAERDAAFCGSGVRMTGDDVVKAKQGGGVLPGTPYRAVCHYEAIVRCQVKNGKDPVKELYRLLEVLRQADAAGGKDADIGKAEVVGGDYPDFGQEESKGSLMTGHAGCFCLIADEVGRGIVPIERSERKLRDLIGRTLIEAAKAADAVCRVTCGIGERIK